MGPDLFSGRSRITPFLQPLPEVPVILPPELLPGVLPIPANLPEGPLHLRGETAEAGLISLLRIAFLALRAENFTPMEMVVTFRAHRAAAREVEVDILGLPVVIQGGVMRNLGGPPAPDTDFPGEPCRLRRLPFRGSPDILQLLPVVDGPNLFRANPWMSLPGVPLIKNLTSPGAHRGIAPPIPTAVSASSIAETIRK
jgi:hypothetical protein